MGMNRFAIQKPGTRNYIHEWIFHEMVGELGLIKSNYLFFDLFVNGENQGLYALEEKMGKEFGSAMITNFPNHTSPFWNMKQNGDATAAKIDVILGGMETIGSAERSTNIDEMQDMFHTISDGGYAQLLYDLFGEERVEKELDEFLELDFFPRVGGGIGVTRLIQAMM